MPLRPERVVEVRYDHLEGRRFRHTAQFIRWWPDREPRSCTYNQLEETVSFDLAQGLATTAMYPGTGSGFSGRAAHGPWRLADILLAWLAGLD